MNTKRNLLTGFILLFYFFPHNINSSITSASNEIADEDVAYCYPSGTNPYSTYIKEVVFGSIDNTDPQVDKKTQDPSTPGYVALGVRDYTNDYSTSVNTGQNYLISVTFKGNAGATSYIYVWIDFNGNEIFETGELVINNVQNTSQTNKTLSSFINIPSSANSGTTRMRVIGSATSEPTDPCNFTDGGELEDYEIVIVGGNDTTPPDVTLTTPINTVNGPFVVTADFTEDVTGLDAGDFIVSECIISSVTGSGDSYTVDVTPTGADPSTMTIQLPAAAVQDAAGNDNTVSNTLSVTYSAQGGSGCSSPANIAFQITTVEQSTTNGASEAEGAVDGSFVSWPPEHFARTEWESDPQWWQINLGAPMTIEEIKLFKVTGTNDSEFQNVNIYLSDVAFPPTGPTGPALEVIPGAVSSPTAFDYSGAPLTGQFLRIQKNDAGLLKISEVEIIGCVGPPAELALTLNPTNPSSPIATDGSVEAVVTGGTAPYNYTWSIFNQGATPSLLENLGIGNYSVTVVDAGGQGIEGNTDLVFPVDPITFNMIPINASSATASDGIIFSQVLGGWPPYTYAWSNGSTDFNQFNLSPGIYALTATDALGTQATDSWTIGVGPWDLAATAVVTPAQSDGSPTGAIDLTATGGTPGYSFIWSNGNITEDNLNIENDDYLVTITDALGNQIVETFTVGILTGGPCVPEINLSDTYFATAQSSTSSNDFVAANALDANSSNFAKTSWQAGPDFAWWEVTLDENIDFQITALELKDISSSGHFADFDIYISSVAFPPGNATDGLVESVTGPIGSGTTVNFTEPYPVGRHIRLQKNVAGKLKISDVDVLGCDVITSGPLDLTYTVNPPSGGDNGAILLNVFGGTAPYTFDWGPPYNNIQDLSMIGAGTYTVTVTDDVNATITETITLNAVNLTPEGIYHSLTKKLDGGYVMTNSNNLLFKYDEKYQPEITQPLTYRIYGNSSVVDAGTQTLTNMVYNDGEHKYGMNFYKLPINQLPLNKVYTLVLEGGNKDETYYLRFVNYCPGCAAN